MYNHRVMRLDYRSIYLIMFANGIAIGSLLGLLFIYVDRTITGLLTVASIALLTGVCSAFCSFIGVVIFNLLAPVIGGIPMEILPSPSADEKDRMKQSPD